MARIRKHSIISTGFITIADNGDSAGLSNEEIEQFHLWTLGTVWHGVGADYGIGVCELTGLKGDLFILLTDE